MELCGLCDKPNRLDFACVRCNINLHDHCIQKHTNTKDGKHSVIPRMDTLAQIFTPIATGPPLAEKVKVTGPGIVDGYIHDFQSVFDVNTREAGPGNLAIRIIGPAGTPQDLFKVFMEKDRENNCLIHCRYNVTTSGEYSIHLIWSGIEVPGSPYKVIIKDSYDK